MNDNTVNTQPIQPANNQLNVSSFINGITAHYKSCEADKNKYKNKLALSEKLAAYLVDSNADYTTIRIIAEFATDLQRRCKDIQAFRGRHHSAEKDADDTHKKRVKDALKAATA